MGDRVSPPKHPSGSVRNHNCCFRCKSFLLWQAPPPQCQQSIPGLARTSSTGTPAALSLDGDELKTYFGDPLHGAGKTYLTLSKHTRNMFLRWQTCFVTTSRASVMCHQQNILLDKKPTFGPKNTPQVCFAATKHVPGMFFGSKTCFVACCIV